VIVLGACTLLSVVHGAVLGILGYGQGAHTLPLVYGDLKAGVDVEASAILALVQDKEVHGGRPAPRWPTPG
jgi:hypothetical protein